MTDAKGPRDDRWYLSLMSPNTKGPKFAWLDPTSIYINAAAFSDLLDDLIADLKGVEFDVVGGCDAMGFVLGAGLAARTGRGFLPVRKAGKLCVDTDRVSFTNYSGKTQDMEMRQPAFAKGTRVLLADQWIQTGGTMEAAIQLVERQGGTVAGLVTIAMENCTATDAFAARFPVVTAVVRQPLAGRMQLAGPVELPQLPRRAHLPDGGAHGRVRPGAGETSRCSRPRTRS